MQIASNDAKDVVDGETEYPAITSLSNSKLDRARGSKHKSKEKRGAVLARFKSFTFEDGQRKVDDVKISQNLEDRGKTNSAFAHTAKKTIGGYTIKMPLDLEEAHKVNKSGAPSKGRTAR